MANERLINTVSVGIVYAGDTSEYRITDEEKVHIMAEVQEGLEDLASNETAANIQWIYGTLNVNISGFVPWEGARWPGWPETWYRGPDALLWSDPNDKIYCFKGNQYIRIDPANGWRVDAGYPKPIAGNWPGWPANFASGISAALWSDPNDKIYVFKGDEYIRIDPANGWQMDSGYPKPIAGNWPSLDPEFAEGFDSCLYAKANGKVYFFKKYSGEPPKYVRIDPANGWNMDAGYPKPVAGNWPGLDEVFTGPGKGPAAALWGEPNGKIYLFTDDNTGWARIVGRYVRIDPANGWQVDDGYPKPIGLSAGEAEALWRDPVLTQLGFDPGSDGIVQISDFFQNGAGAQYGYVAFFTKFPTVWAAYAGGRRVLMRKGGIPGAISFLDWNSIDRVFAHETGHIFGAPDEYGSSGCNCTSIHGRFIKDVNGNCATCADPLVSCVMRSGAPSQACDFTHAHLGWRAFLKSVGAGFYSFPNDKIYMFSKGYYARFTVFDLDADYPKQIDGNCVGNWPGVPEEFYDLDAATYTRKNHRVYFFKDDQYIRINPSNGWRVDADYPKPIAGNWPGVGGTFADGVDAVLESPPNDKVYFFKGNDYLRIDPNNGWQVDDGYPKPIAGNWPGWPAHFTQGIDAILWSETNQRIYAFRGTQYIRINPSNGWDVDAGYPRWINKNWMPFPEKHEIGLGISVVG